jgi:hypothetical protein
MWPIIWNMAKRFGGGFVAMGDATNQIMESRLWAFNAYVALGLGMILMEFIWTKKINTTALGIMGTACALTTFSIPKNN